MPSGGSGRLLATGMPAGSSAARVDIPYVHVAALIVMLLSATAACGRSPVAPESSSPRYLGRWSGTITSDVIGEGRLTIDLEREFPSPAAVVVGGTSTLAFADARFSGTVSVTGTAQVDTPGTLELIFGRVQVPCPEAPDGIGSYTVFASLTIAGDTMQGGYMTTLCPGGRIRLMRGQFPTW